jgi:prophage DNA circulation protein
MKHLFIFGVAATLFVLSASAQAQAQEAAGAGACIVREQAEQLIGTLKERNDQLRDMSARMREMEARVAAADTATKELENSRKALAIAAEKNRELAEIGEAIIADYEKMDLGKRAAAGEPLTQLYRVKLENKLQEFQDQIAAQGFYPQKELDNLQAAQAAPASAGNP